MQSIQITGRPPKLQIQALVQVAKILIWSQFNNWQLIIEPLYQLVER